MARAPGYPCSQGCSKCWYQVFDRGTENKANFGNSQLQEKGAWFKIQFRSSGLRTVHVFFDELVVKFIRVWIWTSWPVCLPTKLQPNAIEKYGLVLKHRFRRPSLVTESAMTQLYRHDAKMTTRLNINILVGWIARWGFSMPSWTRWDCNHPLWEAFIFNRHWSFTTTVPAMNNQTSPFLLRRRGKIEKSSLFP